MNIIRKARGSFILKDVPRVFLSCDAHNVNDIGLLISHLHSMDAGIACVVSYFEKPGQDINEELLLHELQGTNMLVLWVTIEWLKAATDQGFPIEYRIARELNIPILPIVNDYNLFPPFTQLVGPMHSISITDPEYRVRLKSQLESLLLSSEEDNKISEKAFTANLFLCYRKQDFFEALKFMKAFHDIEGFEAISIWYDNFLKAGRFFDNEIRESIIKSDVFTLLITPNLLKKNDNGNINYMLSTEYPFALDYGKSTVLVEAIPTDLTYLVKTFPEAAHPVRMNDPIALRTAFCEKLDESAYLWQMDSERAYLLGTAYLNGFCVEKDFGRAMQLLKIASKGNDLSALRATQKLGDFFENGIGIAINYPKALYWRKEAAIHCEGVYGFANDETAMAYDRIAAIYDVQGNYQSVLEWRQKALAVSENKNKETLSNIIRRPRNYTEISKRAQRVFFCCNMRNVNGREKLISDLLSTEIAMDYMVSYFEISYSDNDEQALKNELLDNQVLVLWVTEELLEAKTDQDFPIEYRVARDLKIPILPIADNDTLFPRFTELAGAIHGIAIKNGERPEDEYRTQLKAQLETFLASEEIIAEIQEKAFMAEIFLSYRKIDIEEAHRFMKKFHELPEFEAVSIWYDNFLTAGRIFREEINNSISKSDAFVLLATPNLFEKNAEGEDNYVVSHEYPFARKIGKPILAIESITTDPDRFAEIFPGTEQLIPLNDSSAMCAAFKEKLGESAYCRQMNSERLYLLGMAYLKGFGVERDFDKAVRLLEKASQKFDVSGLRAVGQLATIYENGIGIEIDSDKAFLLRKNAIVHSKKIFRLKHPNTATAYQSMAAFYAMQGEYEKALEEYFKALSIYKKISKKENMDKATLYECIATVYEKQGTHTEALKWRQKSLNIYEKVLEKEKPDTSEPYNKVASCYFSQGNYEKSIIWHQKALEIREKILGATHPDMATAYNHFALLYHKLGVYPKVIEWFLKASNIREQVLGPIHLDTAVSYNNIALVYEKNGDYQKALDWHEKALAIRKGVLGSEHPDTLASYNGIANICKIIDDHHPVDDKLKTKKKVKK